MSPNILFLHGHNSGRFIQPYGHGVPTPNLMWLARQGVLFRQAFAAAPSCSPSRASFLTGRHPHCCGMLDYCVPPRPFSDTAALREMTAGYKRSAREMDDCFGVILETLAETGLDRKTYVFAFTDHGLQWPLHIANVGEHGNAAFLIARGPEHFTGGGVLDAMISLMDLFPTVCDLAGLEQPSWLQGQSLLSLTSGEVSALHDKLFFEQTYHAAYEPMRAVRTERHIYIKRFDDRDQLVLPNTDQTPAKGDLLAAGSASPSGDALRSLFRSRPAEQPDRRARHR